MVEKNICQNPKCCDSMTKENIKELIRLVKANSDNNLILLSSLIELKRRVEELETRRTKKVEVEHVV